LWHYDGRDPRTVKKFNSIHLLEEIIMRGDSKIAMRGCLAGLLLAGFPTADWADDLETMGVTLLRASHSTLIGTGIDVAQPEAIEAGTAAAFEVNPSSVDEPLTLFDWISTNGTFTTWPNAAGTESTHADQVADNFYGPTLGVAPGVAHVDNYEADYFANDIIASITKTPISDQVVNQSFAFFPTTTSAQESDDSDYDDYIYDNGNVFSSAVNGLNNGVGPPGTAYNCIGVGDYGAGADIAYGPTPDNGRSKPDMVAPGTAISFTVPYVAGAAAVLMQAAAAGDGGANTTEASNLMTVKALLLNGALKPFDWTNSTTAPLDRRYGAGVLNLYYSYHQLAGGKQSYTSENMVSSGGAHPPISSGQAVGALAGWDFESDSLFPLDDTVNHYLFSVASNSTLTATLVWERHAEETAINNLAVYLYNATTAALVTKSSSLVDNVQHIYVPHLAPGKYDLEVIFYYANSVSFSENYALAFQFYPMSPPALSVALAGNEAIITWPWSPTVYTLQQTSSLRAPDWTNVTATEWITNTTVWTGLTNTGGTAYFRLVR
jgi:hypothetical protein